MALTTNRKMIYKTNIIFLLVIGVKFFLLILFVTSLAKNAI